MIDINLKHGHARRSGHSREYRTWDGMTQRCTNPNEKRYSDYGGRGITICEEWRPFIGFYTDMGSKPSPTHSLDRIDNNGNYCKENCRWATRKEQYENQRTNKWVELNGNKMLLSHAITSLKVGMSTIYQRINK